MLVLHALNALALAALHARSPAFASRVVGAVAKKTPVRLDADRARHAIARLRGGTCLSRSIALASVVDGAEVVIGVRPGDDGAVAKGVHAHAWVEVNARALRDEDVIGQEIARVKPGP
jgi:Transglutaminase-like superfamily